MTDPANEEFDCTIVTNCYTTQTYSLKWTIHNFSEMSAEVKSGYFCPFESMACIMELKKVEDGEGKKGLRVMIRVTCAELHYAVDGNVTLRGSTSEVITQWSFSCIPVAPGKYAILTDKKIKTDEPLKEEFCIVVRLSAKRKGEETKIVYNRNILETALDSS